MVPRSTACSAQDSGSMNAACVGKRVADLCPGIRREDHVLGHGTGRTPLEPVDGVRGAHPVLAAAAVTTLPAGHDLLGGDPVTDVDAPALRGGLVELDHPADKLVPGHDRGLRVRRPVLVAPELRGSVVALQVAGADADRLDPDECLAWSSDGPRELLEAVVAGTVVDHGLHGVRHGPLPPRRDVPVISQPPRRQGTAAPLLRAAYAGSCARQSADVVDDAPAASTVPGRRARCRPALGCSLPAGLGRGWRLDQSTVARSAYCVAPAPSAVELRPSSSDGCSGPLADGQVRAFHY